MRVAPNLYARHFFVSRRPNPVPLVRLGPSRTELRSARLRSSGAQAIQTPHHTHAKTLTINHVFKFLSRDLRDDSPEVTLETILSIVRPEGSELGRWLGGFLSLSADVDACRDTALSKKTLFFYFAGQVSRSEIKALPTDARWPTTEEEKKAFRLSSLVPHVEKHASSLPPFHTSEVREHTRELLATGRSALRAINRGRFPFAF